MTMFFIMEKLDITYSPLATCTFGSKIHINKTENLMHNIFINAKWIMSELCFLGERWSRQ